MITIRSITKTFPGVKALDDISLEVKAGEFFGLPGTSALISTISLWQTRKGRVFSSYPPIHSSIHPHHRFFSSFLPLRPGFPTIKP